MPDCFMVIADEPNASENWVRLRERVPATRIENAPSIYAAYHQCAMRASTPHFFVVDGDNWLVDDFQFTWDAPPAPGHVYVWRAKNPVNDLVYGHGAIKLFCVHDWLTPRAQPVGIDVTMNTGSTYQIINALASEHRFNTSPFHTWRTAFRECVKLATYPHNQSGAPAAAARLHSWMTQGADRPFGQECIAGARQGAAFGRQHAQDIQALRQVNDYGWLQHLFTQQHAKNL